MWVAALDLDQSFFFPFYPARVVAALEFICILFTMYLNNKLKVIAALELCFVTLGEVSFFFT